MSKLKLYATTHKLNKGSTVHCDDTLFLAIMAEVVKNSHETYADYIRSVLAAVCLDRTEIFSNRGNSLKGMLITRNRIFEFMNRKLKR